MHNLNNLKIWRKSMNLVKEVYTQISDVSSEEKFGLVAQIKRSAISIPSNIAEGAGRNSNKEFRRFLGIANGSTFELQTQLILLQELKLINPNSFSNVIDLCIEIQKMNYALQQKLIT